MWVWTRPPAEDLVACAQAYGVRDLFLAVPNDLPSSDVLPWVRSVANAAGKSTRLHALGGDPRWADEPSKAVAWQAAAVSTGLFVGSHVDLECWRHDAWDTDRDGVVARYLQALERLTAAATVPLEADVAHWLHTVPTHAGQALDSAVLDLVDRVTIMSFRNTVVGPDSITDIGALTLSAATARDKPARLAVETNYLGDDHVSRKQTFYGQTSDALAVAMRQVDGLERAVPSYAGISVQDYAGWAALP